MAGCGGVIRPRPDPGAARKRNFLKKQMSARVLQRLVGTGLFHKAVSQDLRNLSALQNSYRNLETR